MATDTSPAPSPAVAPAAAPHRRRAARVTGLALGWALVAAYGALLARNAGLLPGAEQATGALTLGRLLALPGLPLSPDIAPWADETLAALALGAVVVLAALTFQRRPVAAPPAPPASSAPAAPPIAPHATAPSGGGAPAPAGQGSPQPATVARGKRRIFISHASGDNDFGHALAEWLQAQLGPDWVVWYDSHGKPDEQGAWEGGIRPAGSWMEEIQREVMACDVFVVIETQAAMSSYWVQQEIQMAWTRKPGAGVEQGLVVVPALRETCDLPPLLSLVQYVDFRPSADLSTAHDALLAAVRSPGAIPARVEVGPPFDLSVLNPADRFIGREDSVRWVIERLTDPSTARLANIAAANGQGGIGKTALAAEAVRRLMATPAFRDGIAAMDCRDKHSEADALALLQETLARFSDGRRKPEDASFAALGDVARRLLGGKRTLVVLDNVEADLPASKLVTALRDAGVAVLLTSRAPLAAAPEGVSLRLDVLPEDDALALFADAYGRALSAAEAGYARRIVVALGRHTLAVKLAGASAATQQRPLDALADAYERNPLREAWLKNNEIAVSFILESSVAAMSEGGQRLFAALGAVATADVGRQATLALAGALGEEEDAAEASLRWIIDLRLADPATIELLGEDADRERLRLHPLTQAWARDLFAGRRALSAAAWGDTQRQQIERGLAAWYANYTNAIASNEGLTYLALTPDEANISSALDWALAHTDDRAAAHICDGMRGFWRDTGRTRAGLTYLPRGAAAAGRIADTSGERDDRRRQANITLYLGDILKNTGRLTEAESIYLQDLDLRRETQDRRGEGVVLSNLGQIAQARGRLAEAADYYQQSLAIRREVQDRQGEGVDLSSLGQIAQARGRLGEAADYFQQSLAIRREVQDRRGEGVVLATLGQVAEARGQYAQAAQAYRDGIEVLREVSDRINVAAILEALGAVLLQHLDDHAGGCAAFAEAIALWHEMELTDREERAQADARELGCPG